MLKKSRIIRLLYYLKFFSSYRWSKKLIILAIIFGMVGITILAIGLITNQWHKPNKVSIKGPLIITTIIIIALLFIAHAAINLYHDLIKKYLCCQNCGWLGDIRDLKNRLCPRCHNEKFIIPVKEPNKSEGIVLKDQTYDNILKALDNKMMVTDIGSKIETWWIDPYEIVKKSNAERKEIKTGSDKLTVTCKPEIKSNYVRRFDWLEIHSEPISQEQILIDMINQSKNEKLPLDAFMPFSAIYLPDDEFFGGVMQEDVLLIGGYYKGGKIIGFEDAYAFYPKTHRVRKRFAGLGGISCFTRWNQRVVIGHQNGYIIWEPPDTQDAMLKWSGCELKHTPEPITAVHIIGEKRFLLLTDNTVLLYDDDRKKDMLSVVINKLTGIWSNQDFIIVTRDDSRQTGGWPAAICFRNEHPLIIQMNEYEKSYATGVYNCGDTAEMQMVNQLLALNCSYAQDVRIWNDYAIVLNFHSTFIINLKDPIGPVFHLEAGGIAIAQNPKKPEEFWIGNAGEGLFILRYDAVKDEWFIETELSKTLNADLQELTGSRRICISAVHFFRDEVFLGTERQGLFLAKNDQ